LLRQGALNPTPHISRARCFSVVGCSFVHLFALSGSCAAVQLVWSDYVVTFCLWLSVWPSCKNTSTYVR